MSLGRIAHYLLLERIGVGAESNIYRARDERNGQIVAIKDVIARESENYKYLGHITNEFRVLRILQQAAGESGDNHGIVRVFGLLRSGFLRREKRRSLIMEFVPGKDLRRERRYPLLQLLDLFRQVAVTVEFMHSVGYVHADLKPENIMVGPQGRATLVDFGFSCRAGTGAETVRGTRDYMAPEQVHRGLITERTDIYNLGATMYYLLTGKHVPAQIAPANGGEYFIRSNGIRPVPVRELNPAVPEGVARLIERCCELAPLKRPAAMTEVREVLTAACRDLPAEGAY